MKLVVSSRYVMQGCAVVRIRILDMPAVRTSHESRSFGAC